MVTDFVAFSNRAAQHTRVLIHAVADDIECRFDVSRGEHVKQARGVSWVRTIVISHRDVVSGNHHAGEGDTCGFGKIARVVASLILRGRAIGVGRDFANARNGFATGQSRDANSCGSSYKTTAGKVPEWVQFIREIMAGRCFHRVKKVKMS